jgi:hypothetical protein
VRDFGEEKQSLEERVHHSLDCAKENGYFAKGEFCHGASDEDLAEDLVTYDADLEDETEEAVLPFVKTWRAKNGDV